MTTARQRLAEQRRKAQRRNRRLNIVVWVTVLALLILGIVLDLWLQSHHIYL